MDAEILTVRAFLESQMVKPAVIDRTVENLEAEGYDYVEQLKELTYYEVIGLKVPVFAAKKLQPHLKLLVPAFKGPSGNNFVDKQVWDELLACLSPDDMCTALDAGSLRRILFQPLACKVPVPDLPLVADYPQLFEESTDGRWAPEADRLLGQFCRRRTLKGAGEVMVSCFYNWFVAGLAAVLQREYGLAVEVEGSQVDPSLWVSKDKTRRDVSVRVCSDSIPVLVGEHKDTTGIKDAEKDMRVKHRGSAAGVFGKLEYIFGYAADGDTVQLIILPLDARESLIIIGPALDMNIKQQRQTFVIAMINIFRWVRTINEGGVLCHAGLALLQDHYRESPWNTLDPDNAGMVKVNIGLNHVRKEFKIPRWALDDFEKMYSHMHDGSLTGAVSVDVIIGKPCFEQVLKKRKRRRSGGEKRCRSGSGNWVNIELHISPVGCKVMSDMKKPEVFVMVRSILGCLKLLHSFGFCHYDVRLANVIQYRGQFLLCDSEVAGRIGSPLPSGFRSDRWKPGCDRTYEVLNDLYMVGKQLIAVCRHSSELLKGFGERLVSGDISSAGQALETVEELMVGEQISN